MIKSLAEAEVLEPGFRQKHAEDTLHQADEEPEIGQEAWPPFACPPCEFGESTEPVTVFKGHCLLAAEIVTSEGPGGSMLFCAAC